MRTRCGQDADKMLEKMGGCDEEGAERRVRLGAQSSAPARTSMARMKSALSAARRFRRYSRSVRRFMMALDGRSGRD